MALGDAQVLTDRLVSADRVDDVVLESFARGRLPKAGAVVEASRQIAQWTPARDPGDVPALQARISRRWSRSPPEVALSRAEGKAPCTRAAPGPER